MMVDASGARQRLPASRPRYCICARVLRMSTTGASPDTVIDSSNAPDGQFRIDGRGELRGQVDPFTSERCESRTG